MLLFIMFLLLTGLSILLLVTPKTKLSNLLLFPLILGIAYHSIIFLILAYFQVYYTKVLFITSSVLMFIICIIFVFKNKTKICIKNDLKKIPIYYILFLLYIVYRFIVISQSTFVNFNNWDELRVYHYICKEIFITHNVNYMYELFAPMTYFIGTMTYEFCGVSVTEPRIFGGILYGIMSLFIYSRLREFKVNKHISALLSMLFLVSSGEVFLYYITFYNNIYYSAFLLIGLYMLLKSRLIEKDRSNTCIAYILLIAACLTRREPVFHVIAILVLLEGYLFFRKKSNIKQLIISILPFISIFATWSIFSNINRITANIKNNAPAFSIINNIVERFNINDLITFNNSSWIAMFDASRFLSNYLLFAVALAALIVCVVKLCKKKKQVTDFIVFQIMQQFIYYGIVLLTALLLFSETEYLKAASFSRYMMMVTPISFITLGILLFENTEIVYEDKNKYESNKLKKCKVLFIIPAYNEESSIKKTYESIQNYNKEYKKDYEAVVINDGSTDKTRQVLESNNIPHVNLINNLGIGGAVQTGYKYAKKYNYDIAIQFDGDGQHDIKYVENLINPIINGEADMVIGSRFIDKDRENFKSTWIRRIGINVISYTIRLLTKKKIYDTTSGYRACNKDIINLFSKSYPTEYPEPVTEVRLLKKGYRITEVYAKMTERKSGKSSITKKIWVPLYYMFNVILSILVEGMVRNNDK